MTLLKHFIIGSSFPIIFTFYYSVYKKQPKKNYSYFNYTFVAPIYFGLYNVILNIIGNKYGWSLRKRYFIFTFISWITTITYSSISKSYNFNSLEWKKYYLYLLLKYLILWNVIVINIEKNM